MAKNQVNLLLDIVQRVEKESHCRRNQIGAILTNSVYDTIIAFGYNGNYKKGPNTCDSDEIGKCGCIHAEANALVKPRSENPYAIFVSETPCLACAKLVVNAGIREVWVNRRYRDADKSISIFTSLGILYCERTEGVFNVTVS